MTIFLGCGFVAKYPEGGGNFAVPLQWMLGLKRRRKEAVWLEILPASGDEDLDARRCTLFLERLALFDLTGCVLITPSPEVHELERMTAYGLPMSELKARLAGPNLLLNLSYSIHPPLVDQFEARWFCDLDPAEIAHWMGQMEMGQSHHDRFFTIGLNIRDPNCRTPRNGLQWEPFPPLVDTEWYQPTPLPGGQPIFSTIGQWFWDGAIEVNGEYPDLSKCAAFEKYMLVPSQVPEARFELAANIGDLPEEVARLAGHGWHWVDPHEVVPDPWKFRDYLTAASAEFTAIKGVDCLWQTGWVSDRAIAYLALGRPVLTEPTGAALHLPEHGGFRWIRDVESAVEAAREVVSDGARLGLEARRCAVEVFDAAAVLQRCFGL